MLIGSRYRMDDNLDGFDCVLKVRDGDDEHCCSLHPGNILALMLANKECKILPTKETIGEGAGAISSSYHGVFAQACKDGYLGSTPEGTLPEKRRTRSNYGAAPVFLTMAHRIVNI